jgi:hypothetical protein
MEKLLATHSALIFILFIAAAVLIMAGFYWGRRKNLAMIKGFSREIEAALHPLDQTYTWIGGVIGFRADYQIEREFSRVEATCTLLPRQSVLYFPVARLVTGFDRLFLVFHVEKKIKEEAHVLEPWYGKTRGPKIRNRAGLYSEHATAGARAFEILFKSPSLAGEMKSFLGRLEQPDLLKHLAINPETQTLYLLMIPRPAHIQNYLAHAIELIHDLP